MKFGHLLIFMFSFNLTVDAQIDYALQWDRVWEDTLLPVKVKPDSASCHISEQTPQTVKKGKIQINNWDWFLCLERQVNGKKEFFPLHLSDMGEIELKKTEYRDVTNDETPELVLTYRSGYSEYHFESGGGWYRNYLVVIDTSDLEILFSAITHYDYSLREVHYKDEDVAGVNNLEKHEIVSDTSSEFKLEYVVRFKENMIELVCMKYINKGIHYKEYELLNPGIIKYKWENEQWIKR